MELVSIVTVCLNSEKTIERTIKSVINQTYSNIEYIIIDGKSTDGTLEIIRKYENMFKGRIKVVSEEDNGLYDAMNKGIRMAKGEIIGLLNSDDWYEENAIELVMNKYPLCSECIIYGMLRKYKGDKIHSIEILHSDFLETQGMCHSSCFISRKAYEVNGLYDTKFKIASDFDLLIRMKRNNVEYIPIYEVLTNFTLGGASSTYPILKELNRIRYQYGIVSKGRYIWKSIKIFLHL